MASKTLVELLARNSKFSQKYQAPPGLMAVAQAIRASGAGVIILSCSDPRLNPYQIFGLDSTIKGVTMIRNAGGRAFDAVRSISALQAIGNPRAIVVLHHTDCGMAHFRDADVRKSLLEIAPQEEATISAMSFGEISGSIDESVKEDVALLSASPFIQPGTRILGMKYDIDTGVVSQVDEAAKQ